MPTWEGESSEVMDLLEKHPNWTIRHAICESIPDCTFYVGSGLTFDILENLPIKELKRRVRKKEFTREDEDEWEIIVKRLKH